MTKQEILDKMAQNAMKLGALSEFIEPYFGSYFPVNVMRETECSQYIKIRAEQEDLVQKLKELNNERR